MMGDSRELRRLASGLGMLVIGYLLLFLPETFPLQAQFESLVKGPDPPYGGTPDLDAMVERPSGLASQLSHPVRFFYRTMHEKPIFVVDLRFKPHVRPLGERISISNIIPDSCVTVLHVPGTSPSTSQRVDGSWIRLGDLSGQYQGVSFRDNRIFGLVVNFGATEVEELRVTCSLETRPLVVDDTHRRLTFRAATEIFGPNWTPEEPQTVSFDNIEHAGSLLVTDNLFGTSGSVATAWAHGQFSVVNAEWVDEQAAQQFTIRLFFSGIFVAFGISILYALLDDALHARKHAGR
jgi:hypothetical protein